jgi:hypothetical protein
MQRARGVSRGTFVKTIPMMFVENTTRYKHHLCMKQEEEQSPYVDYIVVAMSDSLDEPNRSCQILLKSSL